MDSKGKRFFKILLILSLIILITSCSSNSADTTAPSASLHPTVDATGPTESPQPPVDAMATFTQSEGDIDVTPSFTTENTLVETPEYTGVIISENGASEFSYLFDKASTGFWEPSINDISRAEECIRQHIVSVQDNPKLDTYQKESAAFILNNLEKYRRQYVGIDVEGEKRIWCNSFFSDDSFPDWERVPVDVDGGGKHFWQIEYDLLKDECINFYVHGES